jgi:hypothetical protein
MINEYYNPRTGEYTMTCTCGYSATDPNPNWLIKWVRASCACKG